MRARTGRWVPSPDLAECEALTSASLKRADIWRNEIFDDLDVDTRGNEVSMMLVLTQVEMRFP